MQPSHEAVAYVSCLFRAAAERQEGDPGDCAHRDRHRDRAARPRDLRLPGKRREHAGVDRPVQGSREGDRGPGRRGHDLQVQAGRRCRYGSRGASPPTRRRSNGSPTTHLTDSNGEARRSHAGPSTTVSPRGSFTLEEISDERTLVHGVWAPEVEGLPRVANPFFKRAYRNDRVQDCDRLKVLLEGAGSRSESRAGAGESFSKIRTLVMTIWR